MLLKVPLKNINRVKRIEATYSDKDYRNNKEIKEELKITKLNI